MEQNKRYVLGIDFGTDSCRALVVDSADGRELATGVCNYPRWAEGLYCDPAANRYCQHPVDYIEAMTDSVREAIGALPAGEGALIEGICIDTTGSTPVLTDRYGTPLALTEQFAVDPDAMFVLWKDHTAVKEADDINELARKWSTDYTMYSGGTYSSEWVWSKVLHIVRTNRKIREAAFSWAEHCDWMTGLITGQTSPGSMKRSRCAAGHKAMWNSSWGLPSEEFLAELDPALAGMRANLYTNTDTCDAVAGRLNGQWAVAFGLKEGIAVAVGALDAHMGAVGASVGPGVLTRVIGTSTCDIMVASYDEIGGQAIEGICGQVDGSVLPGMVGLEAGQSAFGDIYAWFASVASWFCRACGETPSNGKVLEILSCEAAALPTSVDSIVSLDWMNGRRTPYADQGVKGVIAGLTLGSTAPAIFRSLVEATAFGSRNIVDHLKESGVRIDSINAIGGISKKAPFVMQTLADVLRMPIKVVRSEQACALGSAMYAAVAAGIYPDIAAAQRAMGSPIEVCYEPDTEKAEIYDKLYSRYIRLTDMAEN